jgi:hypothetical protein
VNEQMSDREVQRLFVEVGRRMDGIETRLTGLASNAVMTNVWSLENGHVRDLITNVETRSKERHDEILKALDTLQKGITRKSEWTWQRGIGVAGVVAVIIAAWVTAVITSKGIH